METIINVDDVSFSYGTQTEQALKHISLGVNRGDFIGIIGPSGAGKSTLAACLSGAVPHHYTGTFFGSVTVDGNDTCEVSLTDVSQIVGSVLQDIDTQMVASVVEDEMLFGLENFGVPHAQIEQRVSETLKTVGISDLRDREIATLSGGQKQKVAIAAILAMRPRVLVLDEPTAALDPASSTLVFETLREANRALGITIVVVEQKVALLSEYCNRVLVLDHGEIALQGKPHEVFAHTDELRAIGVDCPRVTRIFNSLEADGLASGTPCLDVDEAERLITGIVDPAHASSDIQAPAGSPHAPSLRPHAKDAEPVLTFDHVEFVYPNGGAAVHDLNLTLYPGELVASSAKTVPARPRSPSCSQACLSPPRAACASRDWIPQPFPRAASPAKSQPSSKTPTARSARTPCSTRSPLAWSLPASTVPRRCVAPSSSSTALACRPTRHPSRSRAVNARWWHSPPSWS